MQENISGGSSGRARLDQIGQRDANRELYRARQSKRTAARERHENPPVWAFQGTKQGTKRLGRGK